jgi:DNA-binding LytR/AlgR family response regulator
VINAGNTPGAVPAGGSSVPALFVKSNTRLIRVPLDDILYIEAVTGYAVVVTRSQQILSNQSIKELADRLPTPQFERVHRSYVVNRERIESVEDNSIFLAGGRAVPIGKTYLADFLNSLKA